MLSDILLALVVKECLWRIPPPRLLTRQVNHKQSASVFAMRLSKWQALKTMVGNPYPSVFRRGLLINPLWGSFCDRQLPTLLPCHLRTFRASPLTAIFVSRSFTLCEENSFLANEIRTGRSGTCGRISLRGDSQSKAMRNDRHQRFMASCDAFPPTFPHLAWHTRRHRLRVRSIDKCLANPHCKTCSKFKEHVKLQQDEVDIIWTVWLQFRCTIFSCAQKHADQTIDRYRTSSRIAVDPFLVWLGTPLIGSEALLHNKIEEPRQAESKIVKTTSLLTVYNCLILFTCMFPVFLSNLEQHHFDL